MRLFDVPQVVAAGEIGRQPTLPSFLYFPTAAEQAAGQLPGTSGAEPVAGVFARDHGALLPARQIASAKSWLANAVGRSHAPLLPWAWTKRRGTVAGRGLGPPARASPRRLESRTARRRGRRPDRPAGRCPDRAGLVRRGGARADAGGGAHRRPAGRHAARGAAGGALRMDRRASARAPRQPHARRARPRLRRRRRHDRLQPDARG